MKNEIFLNRIFWILVLSKDLFASRCIKYGNSWYNISTFGSSQWVFKYLFKSSNSQHTSNSVVFSGTKFSSHGDMSVVSGDLSSQCECFILSLDVRVLLKWPGN